VKDFVREYWKSAAAGAAGSFLLSLLVGLVTRNPFGVVFLRALLLAVLFAGLAAALMYLIRTHLLETAREGASAQAGRGDTRDDRRGERIDIVLPEESPIGSERYGTGGRGARSPGLEDENPSLLGAGLVQEEGAVPGGFASEQADSEGLAELAEELAEEVPQSAAYVGAQADETEEVPGDTVEAEEADEMRENADARGPGKRISDDRDGLPDISNLEIATETNGEEPEALPGNRPGGARPEDALRGAVSGQDPATIARAIRTVLKRDDKG
jgi:hypothetical protein